MQTSAKILIVDDDPMNVCILEDVLSDDYELRSAETGEEALSIAASFHPDLILLDIMMPDIDGFELCRRFRADRRLGFTKIILVSAKSMLRDRLRGYGAGADDYITKPFDHGELIAKVNVFLRLKSVQEVESIQDDLINIFSHGTITPLNTIIGFAKILQDSPSLKSNEQEAVEHIIRSGEELMELADKTILLSNLKKGTRPIRKQPQPLPRLLETAIVRAAPVLEPKQLQVNNKVNRNITVEADEELIVTAIVYLLDNAAKYSAPRTGLDISCNNNKTGLTLHVCDFGKGVPNDKIDILFDEFVVGDVDHHSRGYGLGLPIARLIMELHGGTATAVNNADGKGTTFSLFFPKQLVKS